MRCRRVEDQCVGESGAEMQAKNPQGILNQVLGGDSELDQDERLLKLLLDELDGAFAVEAFADMLAKLRQYRHPLTDKQRAWAIKVCEELGIDFRSHEERNKDVPRGREVIPPPVLCRPLPLSPPGRGPLKVKTQLDRAQQIVESIKVPQGQDLHQLKEILAKAQNRPPLGVSDGSFSEQQWIALRDLIEQIENVQRCLVVLRDEIPF